MLTRAGVGTISMIHEIVIVRTLRAHLIRVAFYAASVTTWKARTHDSITDNTVTAPAMLRLSIANIATYGQNYKVQFSCVAALFLLGNPHTVRNHHIEDHAS